MAPNYQNSMPPSSPALGQYQQRLATSMRMLQGLGKQQKKDIGRRWQAAEGAGVQDLVSRGLTGSTILPTMRMGYQRERESELGRLNESLRQQQLGVYGSLSGEMAAATQEDYWQRQQQGQQDYWQQQKYGLDQGRLNLDRLRQQQANTLSQGRLGLDTRTQGQQSALGQGRLGLDTRTQGQQYSLGQGRLGLDRNRSQYLQSTPKKTYTARTISNSSPSARGSSSGGFYTQPSYLQQAQSRFLIKRGWMS